MVEIVWNKRHEEMWLYMEGYDGCGEWIGPEDLVYARLAPVLSLLAPNSRLLLGTCESAYNITMAEYTAITGKEELP